MTLDINDSAIHKKFHILPDEHEENVISWLQNDTNREFPKHKKIEPFPGICVKTWSENGDKIFINICHSMEIVAPEDISDEQFQKLLQEDVPSFVIPMAIGMEKMVKDKCEIERSTFDILINTKYFEKCMKKDHFLQFSIAAIMESINDKYQKSISDFKHVILKNKKVMGSLDTFTIEDREPKKPVIKKPLIQVIDMPEEVQKKSKNINSKKDYDPKINNYVIMRSNNQNNLIGLFYLPSSNITDITVDIGDNHIIIENQKADIIIDIFVPHKIDNNQVTANFDRKLHILRLILPLKIIL